MPLNVDLFGATDAIYKRWTTQWGTTTAFVFKGEDHDSLHSGKLPWARVSVMQTGGGQETLGRKTNRKYRRSASIIIQVYTLQNQGVKQATQLAKQAADVFEGESFSGVDVNDAVIRGPNPEEDGKWDQTVVEAFFDYDETK